jgi:hypothetical protein
LSFATCFGAVALHFINDLLLDLGRQVGWWHGPPDLLKLSECSASQLLPKHALNRLGVKQSGITGGFREVVWKRYLNRRHSRPLVFV